MKKALLSLIILSVCLMLVPVTTGSARGIAAHPLSAPLLDETSFTFSQLREEDIRMFSPFASKTMLFGLPANWKVLEGAQLELDMTVAIQNSAASTSIYGGTLTVALNENTIAVLSLNQSGSFTQAIKIPSTAFYSNRPDGRSELSFLLSTSQSCVVDQKMDVTIRPSSRFTVPHDVIQPDTNLANFPRPLYQDSMFVDSARIVIPDQPTASELQAALTVAAGLEARTDNSMLIDTVSSSGLTEDKLSDSHLILVGNAASLPVLYQLLLPMGVSDGKFVNAGDAGVLEMIVSPWNSERVILVVSGNDDQATVKAAQALSTGVIRSNSVSNLSLISNVNPKTYSAPSSVDRTLADLGYDNAVFEGRGENTETYQFYIPVGQTVTAEAYFEISLSNSTLLNYNRSGLFVVLNDRPIGSIRLSDDTANNPQKRVRIAIPASAVRVGLNYLDVTASLEPIDDCADPNQTGLFVTIWSDSRLYLPLKPAPISTADVPALAKYPMPFIQSPELSQTAFVLQHDSPESWGHAIKIAADLGGTSAGAIFTPAAFYADAIPDSARSNYNMLMIGIPSKMQVISEINDKLPGPFANGSDLADEKELQVIYQIDPSKPAGYLELLQSPWNPENVIITVAGNSPEGVFWAGEALLGEASRAKLLGNFAVVTDKQIITVDTRLISEDLPVSSPATMPDDTQQPVTQPEVEDYSTPLWIPVALGFTVVLILIVIGVAIYMNRKRK
jgi:hypothetical protein